MAAVVLGFSIGNSWDTNRFRSWSFYAHNPFTSTRSIEASGERSPKLFLVAVVCGAGDLPSIPEKRMKKLVYFSFGTNQITGLCNWPLRASDRLTQSLDHFGQTCISIDPLHGEKIIRRRFLWTSRLRRSLIEHRRLVLHPLQEHYQACTYFRI